MNKLQLVLVSGLAALLMVGCGDDDNDIQPDANDLPDVTVDDDADVTEDADVDDDAAVAECPDLEPTGDGANDLIISEVSPGNHVGLFNPTDADIDLADGNYQLCQMPAYAALTGTVPAKGYLLVDWPAGFTEDATAIAGEEVALYADIGDSTDFGEGENMRDFVCWGTGSVGGSRQTLAGEEDLWDGGCVTAIAAIGEAVIRLPETDGTSAASYETGDAPELECAP
jgi:hypothetical protein